MPGISEAKAVLRFVRMTPRKIRMVVDLIRGRNVSDALSILKYLPRSTAKVVEQLLHSVVANAEQKELGGPESLRVIRAYVDGGPVLKRFRARSMGRANPIKKRTSHVTIVVAPSGTSS